MHILLYTSKHYGIMPLKWTILYPAAAQPYHAVINCSHITLQAVSAKTGNVNFGLSLEVMRVLFCFKKKHWFYLFLRLGFLKETTLGQSMGSGNLSFLSSLKSPTSFPSPCFESPKFLYLSYECVILKTSNLSKQRVRASFLPATDIGWATS